MKRESKMGDYVKELTIIDFLGIFVPGAILLLLLSLDFGAAVVPLWQGVFGEDAGEGVKIVFLLVGGYLVGMLLHELRDIAERLLWLCPKIDPRIRAYRAVEKIYPRKLKDKVDRYFLKSAMGLGSRGGSPKAQDHEFIRRACQGVQAMVYQKPEMASKLRQLEGFHIVMRNLFLAIVISSAAVFFHDSGRLYCYQQFLLTHPVYLLIVGGVLLLMVIRSDHYAYLRSKYLYEDFVLLGDASRPQG